MSLVRLLKMGRSLNMIAETQSRYRMPRQNLLPKFGRAGAAIRLSRNPATEPALSTAPSHRPSSRANVVEGPIKRAHAESKWAKLIRSFWSHLDRVRTLVGETMKPLSQLAARSGADRLALRRRTASPSVLLPKPNPTLTQTELSLDNVKVIRNDLSDTDLELAPLTTTSGLLKEGPPAQFTVLNGSWSRLKARLFHEPVSHRNVTDSHLGLKPSEKEFGWSRLW